MPEAPAENTRPNQTTPKVQLPFGQMAMIVAASVAIAVAAMAMINKLTKPTGGLGAGDDAPIIMAGGSFYVGTHGEHHFKTIPAAGKTPEHLELYRLGGSVITGRYVPEVSFFDDDDIETDYPIGSTPSNLTINIEYSDPASQDSDTITFTYTDDKTPISISDLSSNIATMYPMAHAHRILWNLLKHPKDWQVVSIKSPQLNGNKKIPCKGQCSIVIHTCLTGDDCAK